MHYKANHRILDFVNKPCSMNRIVSCATGKDTKEIMLIVRNIICVTHMVLFTHSLWNSNSMNLSNVITMLESFYRMFEKARGCTLTKGTWFVA